MVSGEKFMWEDGVVLVGNELLKVSNQNNDVQCLRELS